MHEHFSGDPAVANTLFFGNIDPSLPTQDDWRTVSQEVAPLLTRLGEPGLTPGLGEVFGESGGPDLIARQHLAHTRNYLLRVHDDAYVSGVIAPYVTKFANRPLLDSTQVTGNMLNDLYSVEGMSIGPVGLHFVGGQFMTESIKRQPSPWLK